jgi:hypothetical protein
MNNLCVNCGEADMVPAGRRDEPYLGLPGTTIVRVQMDAVEQAPLRVRPTDEGWELVDGASAAAK